MFVIPRDDFVGTLPFWLMIILGAIAIVVISLVIWNEIDIKNRRKKKSFANPDSTEYLSKSSKKRSKAPAQKYRADYRDTIYDEQMKKYQNPAYAQPQISKKEENLFAYGAPAPSSDQKTEINESYAPAVPSENSYETSYLAKSPEYAAYLDDSTSAENNASTLSGTTYISYEASPAAELRYDKPPQELPSLFPGEEPTRPQNERYYHNETPVVDNTPTYDEQTPVFTPIVPPVPQVQDDNDIENIEEPVPAYNSQEVRNQAQNGDYYITEQDFDERNKSGSYQAKFRCADGHISRSMQNAKIDNWLHENRIVHYCDKQTPVVEQIIFADFYLPKYNAYVKFRDGQNNSKMEMEENLFQRNKLNLVELQTQDLQNLDFSLPNKLNYLIY